MSRGFNDQEVFWAGEFGADYIARNSGASILSSNISLLSLAMRRADRIENGIEFGPNIGNNLAALSILYPGIDLYGVEINKEACDRLRSVISPENVYNRSMLEFLPERSWDLVLVKGVLIHIDPKDLDSAYSVIFNSSNRYILLAEYYSPYPVSISYRGYEDKLFKRDFSGEMLDKYQSLSLVDYGFVYRRDRAFPQDDLTWFLMEKSDSSRGIADKC